MDEAAMAAARGRLERQRHEDEVATAAVAPLHVLALWLAGVTGSDRPRVAGRIVTATAAGVPPRDPLAEPAMTVGEVAQAVDAGREAGYAAAAAGVTILVGRAGTEASRSAACLAAALTGDEPTTPDVKAILARHPDAARGPLHALRRVGTGGIAVLCGLALGAGERGLGFVCHGLPATAGAAVAASVEPSLRPRLLAAHRSSDGAHGLLLDHLGVRSILEGDEGASAALAVLRRAAAVLDR